MDSERMWDNASVPFDRMRRVYVSVNRQPSWVTRAAVTAGITVLFLVILLLVIPALLVGLAVFFVLSLIHRLRTAITGRQPSRDGRRNVAIIRRDGQDNP